jgi:hypothetical protein
MGAAREPRLRKRTLGASVPNASPFEGCSSRSIGSPRHAHDGHDLAVRRFGVAAVRLGGLDRVALRVRPAGDARAAPTAALLFVVEERHVAVPRHSLFALRVAGQVADQDPPPLLTGLVERHRVVRQAGPSSGETNAEGTDTVSAPRRPFVPTARRPLGCELLTPAAAVKR